MNAKCFSRRGSLAVVLLAGTAGAFACVGCELVVDFDRTKINEPSQGGGSDGGAPSSGVDSGGGAVDASGNS